ncbi:MAG: DUF1285 domain-containing protein [Deltaproteobacteria bacterium]|nr:DUF1285 domain-containing protein [Candidatus Anaeroferrophillus wilburensis]MBN2889568.1 DUF1285 domain-containing protein [Deltaproteobacteria bacterium]
MEETIDRSEMISIDRQGRWWYQGNQIIHQDVLAYFKKSLQRDPQTGDYAIHAQGKTAPVEVALCPFFIHDIELVRDPDDRPKEVILLLDDQSRETLDPRKLTMDKEGVLQALVKEGRFCARCQPTAHFRLAELLEEDAEGIFHLYLGGENFRIGVSP